MLNIKTLIVRYKNYKLQRWNKKENTLRTAWMDALITNYHLTPTALLTDVRFTRKGLFKYSVIPNKKASPILGVCKTFLFNNKVLVTIDEDNLCEYILASKNIVVSQGKVIRWTGASIEVYKCEGITLHMTESQIIFLTNRHDVIVRLRGYESLFTNFYKYILNHM